ncbi:nucleotidyltransferase domain-containing protein [Cellulomonas alba]|uniref:Nucleotidyltransferase domain-containing protein n=1 Tax=Cellulomonas alba TaxID=3053467 RepID=A0ABT7SE61_9CELL|nr:nucleotidyltransferase domain-containing protein [Cellulomonas alba]MDM7854416.1 nucleotidyltransferase domain-containing protein [Cellulomonas alba]
MTTLEDALAGLQLWPHHVETIRRTAEHLEAQPDVVALLLGGSLAHGFAIEGSDVDIVIVVTEEEFARREASTSLTFLSHDLATYEGGYVDGKYVSLEFLRDVADRAGDATRWGYDNARIVFTRDPELADLLARVVRYPAERVAERRERFVAQLLAWRWYHDQGFQKGDPYLQGISLNRVVLFACRLVLVENAMLYPFHKWAVRVTAGAPNRPAALMDDIAALYGDPTPARVEALVSGLLAHYGIDEAAADRTWGAYFVRDTELSWRAGPPPVDDL